MWIRFSLRKLLLLPLVFGFALFSVLWIQDQRQRGSDVLARTMYEHNCSCDRLIPYDGPSRIVPTWQERLLGNTAQFGKSVSFPDSEIGNADSRLFSRSTATQKFTEVSFYGTTLTHASYFPAYWQRIRSLSFHDVKLPEQWKAGLIERSQQVEQMLFAGASIGLTVADVKALSHLKILVLSNLSFSREELIEIRTALPNTKVIVVACYGDRGEWNPSASTFFSGPEFMHYRDRFQKLQRQFAKSKFPQFLFEQEPSISTQEITAFEKTGGIHLDHSIIAFLLARRQRPLIDPIFERLTERPPKVEAFESNDGVTFTRMCWRLGLNSDAEYFNGLQIGDIDGQPLWVGLENGELFVGEESSVVRSGRSNLDKHIDYYFDILEQSIVSKNGDKVPSYFSTGIENSSNISNGVVK